MESSLSGLLAFAVINLVVGIAIGLTLDSLRSRPKLCYWYPHGFRHVIKQDTGITVIQTHAITVQNVGGRTAESIEICLTGKPDHFELWPSLSFEENLNENGNYIISIASLGAMDFFRVEILSYETQSELKYVRHKDGSAQEIKTIPIPQYPMWLTWIVVILMLAGAGHFLYWGGLVGIFLLQGIGVLE